MSARASPSQGRHEHKLLACGMRFMSAGATIPGSPEMPLDRDPRSSVVECFLPWYKVQVNREISAVRRYTLWRAANCVIGREAYRWLDTPDILWRNRRSYIGTIDDDKLLSVLRELDELRARG